MSIIPCGECGRPISDTERSCPYCGYPVNMSINKMLQQKYQKREAAAKTQGKSAHSAGRRKVAKPVGRSAAGRSSAQSRNTSQSRTAPQGRSTAQSRNLAQSKNTAQSRSAAKSENAVQAKSSAKIQTAVKERSSSQSTAVRTSDKKKQRDKAQLMFMAFIGILLLLLIIVMAIFFAKSCGAGKTTKAEPITDEFGFTYYANQDDGGKLYRLDENDANAIPEKLSEHRPGELLLWGDWLYYINNDDDCTIYRISKDGLNELKIVNTSARNMFIDGDWLIYEDKNNGFELYKVPVSDAAVAAFALDPIRDDSSVEASPDDEDEQTSESADEPISQVSDEVSQVDEPDENQTEEESQDTDEMAEKQSTSPEDMVVNNSNLPWNLILANKKNTLSSSYDESIALGFMESGKKVDKRITVKLSEMLADMRSEVKNCDITPTSSYRSIAVQKNYFDRAVQKQVDKGLSQEEAEKTAAKNVAKPGATDHNTGLAVEFNDGYKNFGESKEYKWLKENSYKYGFVERYPQDKEEITGYTWEAYHFRYVGEDAAKVIHDENLCLEEYIYKYCSDCVK